MAFLTLDGITAPVQEGVWQKGADVIGARVRSVNGRLRHTFVANKRRFTGKLIPLDRDTADAWRRLLLGEADHVPWDSTLYSEKGVAPNAGHTAVIDNTFPFIGNYVDTGANPLSYTFGTPSNSSSWTVSVWQFNGSTWDHYVVRNNTAKWFNGVRNDATVTTFLTVGVNNTVTLAAGFLYDELFFMPFFAPDSWPPEIFAFNNNGLAMKYPEMTADGNGIDGGSLTVSPAYSSTDVMHSSGTIKQSESVSFELEEF